MDMDWANDGVLADTVSLVDRLSVPVCMFVTHDTPMLAELREDPLRIAVRYLAPITFAPGAGRRIRPEDLREGIARYVRELEAIAIRRPYRVFRFGDAPGPDADDKRKP